MSSGTSSKLSRFAAPFFCLVCVFPFVLNVVKLEQSNKKKDRRILRCMSDHLSISPDPFSQEHVKVSISWSH